MIAALFSPLRRRVQGFVDRRFYRRAYDAQQVLAQFASVARNETDLERLAAGLGSAVEGALQPRRMGIWLQPMEKGEN
jgi:predicted transcriptional regulator